MKKLNPSALIMAISFAALFATPTFAGGPNKVKIDQENLQKLSLADQQGALRIAARLEAITTIDRSDLSQQERKALRGEVKELKAAAEAYNQAAGGTVVYISTAGIIIILLILIIIL